MAGFKLGDTITGTGNYDTNADVGAIFAQKGQKLGDWKLEASGPGAEQRRYIDTPWGRVYDKAQDDYNRMERGGDNYDEQGNKRTQASTGGAQVGIGRYANESGSDAITGWIDEQGIFQGAAMDRESDADRNWFLAAALSLGIAGAAVGGAAAASGAAGGGAAAGGGTAAAAGGGTAAGAAAGLSTAEIAQLALVGISLAAGKPGGGGSATAGGSGTPDLKGPEAPPAPPMIDYQDLEAPFRAQNRKATKNQTNLNPGGITNALYASGGLLLGA